MFKFSLNLAKLLEKKERKSMQEINVISFEDLK
jgi:hypothetical protein